MDYVAQSIAIDRLDNNVNVIWHDAPREHAIALTVEVQDGIFDQLCDSRFAQPARAEAAIEPFVRLGQVIQLLGKSFGDSSWKAVEETKGDELNRFG